MKAYIQNNLLEGFRVSPLRVPLKAWALVPVFMLVSVAAGFGSGLLNIAPLHSKFALLLPVTLFIFPSLLEEAFFRGVLIPRNILDCGVAKSVRAVTISTLAFVAWHPVNALAFNHTAMPVFLNPWFLVIVFVLGLTCGYGYVVSRSIWVPVIIHWATVMVWVLFLGGRNLVLEF